MMTVFHIYYIISSPVPLYELKEFLNEWSPRSRSWMTAAIQLGILSWPPTHQMFPHECASKWKTSGSAVNTTAGKDQSSWGLGKGYVQPPIARNTLGRLTRSPRSPFAPGTPCKSEGENSSYLRCSAHWQVMRAYLSLADRGTPTKVGWKPAMVIKQGTTWSPTVQNSLLTLSSSGLHAEMWQFGAPGWEWSSGTPE